MTPSRQAEDHEDIDPEIDALLSELEETRGIKAPLIAEDGAKIINLSVDREIEVARATYDDGTVVTLPYGDMRYGIALIIENRAPLGLRPLDEEGLFDLATTLITSPEDAERVLADPDLSLLGFAASRGLEFIPHVDVAAPELLALMLDPEADYASLKAFIFTLGVKNPMVVAKMRRNQIRRIAEGEWTAITSFVDTPMGERSFCYTVGLAARQMPELVITGHNPQLAFQILMVAVDRLATILSAGGQINDGDLIDKIANVPLKVHTISAAGLVNLYEAHEVARMMKIEKVRGLQLLLPDPDGKFPTQDEPNGQPLL